jgi:hypothetical protein
MVDKPDISVEDLEDPEVKTLPGVVETQRGAGGGGGEVDAAGGLQDHYQGLATQINQATNSTTGLSCTATPEDERSK